MFHTLHRLSTPSRLWQLGSSAREFPKALMCDGRDFVPYRQRSRGIFNPVIAGRHRDKARQSGATLKPYAVDDIKRFAPAVVGVIVI
jgi:hypothetical protein